MTDSDRTPAELIDLAHSIYKQHTQHDLCTGHVLYVTGVEWDRLMDHFRYQLGKLRPAAPVTLYGVTVIVPGWPSRIS